MLTMYSRVGQPEFYRFAAYVFHLLQGGFGNADRDAYLDPIAKNDRVAG